MPFMFITESEPNMSCQEKDVELMHCAIELARQAAEQGEVPVGAVVVNTQTGEIISKGYNLRETNKSVAAHAEVIAIEEACKRLGTWRLNGYSLYVTLEPCPMCAGALVNCRIDRVVYGAADPVAGCCGSVINFNSYPFSHSFKLTSGICREECADLLQNFFKKHRK